MKIASLALLIAVGIVLLSGSAGAYEIQGNSVFLEDAQASLRVTPHTAASPVNQFKQEFEVCNKTGAASTLFAAYIFNQPLKAGSVEYLVPIQKNWVEHALTCDYDFNYSLNVFGGQNPHNATCYENQDINGLDYNRVVWEHEFKQGDPGTKTILYDSFEIVSGGNLVNVSDKFSNVQQINGQTVYPFTEGLEIPAYECRTWKIAYQPNEADTSKKWDLWLWAGVGWSCILTDTCTKVLKLDPWWNNNWTYKRQINFPAVSLGQYRTIFIHWSSNEFNGALSDLNDLRIIDESLNADLNRQCNGTPQDGNCFFRLNRDITSGESNYYVYYVNPTAPYPGYFGLDANVIGFETGEPFTYNTSNGYITDGGKKYGDYSYVTDTLAFGNGLYITDNFSDAQSGDFNYSTWGMVPVHGTAGNVNWFVMEDAAHTRICGLGFRAGGTYTTIRNNVGGLMPWNVDLNRWYNFQIQYTNGSNTCYYTVYEEDGNTFWTGSEASGNNNDVAYVAVWPDGVGSKVCFWDNFHYGPPTEFASLGAAEENIDFDVNFSKLDGYPLTDPMPIFSYAKDGNLSIDFNILHSRNYRMTIDINYSDENLSGTGTVIVKDLNLTSDECDSIDWDTSPVNCSWDWNISGVADGNYVLLIKAIDSAANTATDISAVDFNIANTTIDLNFASLDGIPFVGEMKNFAYSVDGNLTIDFNMYSVGNARVTVDINYSDQNALGTGTPIVQNLSLDGVICTSNDWYVTPVVCSWDWNSFGVADGNYVLTIKYNAYEKITPVDFNILSDINLTINRPIDEDTAAEIDRAKYSWTVRITDHTGVRYYVNQIDANGFLIPIGETVSIEIDTNTSDYFPRTYSVSYTEDSTLQPYLASQATSGNFIFKVVDSTSLSPINGVVIGVYGEIAGSGTTGLQTISTDSAGTATIPLRLGSSYTVDFNYGGTVRFTADLTPTAGSLFYQVALAISTETGPADYPGLLVARFYHSPNRPYIISKPWGEADINVSIDFNYKEVAGINVIVLDTNGCIYDNNHFTPPWADGNMIYLKIDLNTGASKYRSNGLPCIYNTQLALYVTVDVNSTDGNTFHEVSRKWNVIYNYEYDLFYRLGVLLPSQLNEEGTLFGTTFLSLLITFICIGSMAAGGIRDPALLGIIALGIMGFFLTLEWIAIIPFAFFAMATVFTIFLTRAVIG